MPFLAFDIFPALTRQISNRALQLRHNCGQILSDLFTSKLSIVTIWLLFNSQFPSNSFNLSFKALHFYPIYCTIRTIMKIFCFPLFTLSLSAM